MDEAIQNHLTSQLANAFYNNDVVAVNELISKGVDIDFIDDHGNTILLEAIKQSAPLKVIKKMVEHNANVNFVNPQSGEAPLFAACFERNERLIKYLIVSKVNINIIDSDGNTPLILACYSHAMGVIKLLLENGADINIKSNDGNTALDIAHQKNSQPAIELLMQAAEGKTIYLRQAKEFSKEKLIKELQSKHGAEVKQSDGKIIITLVA